METRQQGAVNCGRECGGVFVAWTAWRARHKASPISLYRIHIRLTVDFSVHSALGYIDQQFFGQALGNGQHGANGATPTHHGNDIGNAIDREESNSQLQSKAQQGRAIGDEDLGAMFIEEQFFGTLGERDKDNK